MRTPIVRVRDQREQAEHPGLLLNRYLAENVAGGGNPEERRMLLASALTASRCEGLMALYRRALDRWSAGLRREDGLAVSEDVATPPFARLIVGLGQKGVIEAGVRLHQTYGVPFIPGSALKGVAAHYAHEVWGKVDAGYSRVSPDEADATRGQYHRLLFGTTEESGCVRFEDAWLVDGGLCADVMTPHHQQWQTNPDMAPTDFDSPVPVPFLSAAGAFRLALSWQGPDSDQAGKWLGRTMRLLKEALREWGVGGKTSSGYGRLVSRDELKGAPAAQASAATARPAATATAGKRDTGTPAKVKVLAARPKGGFDVQEEGRPKGTLTVGAPPAGVDTSEGAMVDVFIHVDDSRAPQYKWTHTPPKAPPPKGRGGPKR